MMKMMKKSKKGVTLVESVFAVVILSILVIGIMSLLTAGSVKIHQVSNESNVHALAVQKLDMVISAISNGSTTYIKTDPAVELDCSKLADALGFGNDVQIDDEIDLYDPEGGETVLNCRGWYLTLTYKGATVMGFASNSEGVFDN